MRIITALILISGALAHPVFKTQRHAATATSPNDYVSTYESGHVLHKRVTTISQNSGISIGGIVGEALGEQVLSLLPKAQDYNGLIDTLLALVGKANQKFPAMEQQDLPVQASMKHHQPNNEPKSAVVRLLEQARDAPPGPWGGIGSALGSPIGKQIGKLLETA